MMRMGWMAAAALAAGIAVSTARAQDIRVTKPGGEKSSVDWSGLEVAADAPARLFAQTVQADLARSGWFTTAAPGSGEFRVTGSVATRGEQLDARVQVLNAATGRRALGKRYDARAADARRLAHGVADEIVEAVTGRPGFAASRIAVIGRRGANKELFLCDSDGAGLIQLRATTRSVSIPAGAPTGRASFTPRI